MRHMGELLESKQLNEKIQYELQEFRQLNYESFVHDFVRLAVSFLLSQISSNFILKFHPQCLEIPDKVANFIESCLPYLRSHWNEIRSHSCIIIGLLHHHGGKFIDDEKYRNDLETTSSEKISACLKDEQITVRIKAAESLGYLYSEP